MDLIDLRSLATLTQSGKVRLADNTRTNCAQGAIVITDLINIHEVSRLMRSPQKTVSGQLAQFEVLAPR